MSFFALLSPSKMYFSFPPRKCVSSPGESSFQTSSSHTSFSGESESLLLDNPKVNEVLPFSIRHLPPEIRHQIYAYFFLALPPFPITSSNSRDSNHHLQTALALASPFLAVDIPEYLFYTSTTFSFTHGVDLSDFTSSSGLREQFVKRVVIKYGKDAKFPNRDWVLMLNECFLGLESVEFVLPESGGTGYGNSNGELSMWGGPCCSCRERMLKSWRDAVEDAVREGSAGRKGTRESERKKLTLNVRSGDTCLESILVC